jgi:hypothetical protein
MHFAKAGKPMSFPEMLFACHSLLFAQWCAQMKESNAGTHAKRLYILAVKLLKGIQQGGP